MSDSILPSDDRPSSVLFLTPGLANDSVDACHGLLSIEDPSSLNVLWVSYTDEPSSRAAAFQEYVGATPAATAGILIGDTASAGGEGTLDTLETVGAPADLTGLGIAVSEQLRDWVNTGGQTVVCFDSLTALLQYVDIETAYEFLHVLTGRLYTFDAVGHFHMDPDAHDDQLVEQVKTLFDALVIKPADEPARYVTGSSL
jgi:regulator of RNase E activity RraB